MRRLLVTAVGLGLLIGALSSLACGSGSPTAVPLPAPELTETPLDTRLLIEALFLGTGPLADHGNRGCLTQADRMAGWPEGSVVKITMASTLSADERAGVIGPASQAREATGGAITTSVEVSNDADPPPPTGEIWVAIASRDEVSRECGPAADLCVHMTHSGGVIQAGRIVGVENGGPGFTHELGHALFGLCHLNRASLVYRNPEGHAPSSMMGLANRGMRLTEDDLRAIKAVYAAGLRAGAPRSQFIEAGLIKP
jgi:hypothetical protein